MNFSNGRIQLNPQATRQKRSALEVVALGHCPDGVDVKALFKAEDTVAEIEALGYSDEIKTLRTQHQSGVPVPPVYNLPIPIHTLAQFVHLFPNAGANTSYTSKLAGAEAWLPIAVEDFFLKSSNNASEAKKIWVICVDPAKEQEAFLPSTQDDWLNPKKGSAFIRALSIPSAGLMILPDLERIQIPDQLQSPPRMRIANPAPEFLPCSSNMDDGHRERRYSYELSKQREPVSLGLLLSPILNAFAKYRPDMHLLLSIPFDHEQKAEQVQVSQSALKDIATLKLSQLANHLHRVQLIYPYLKSAQRSLMSSTGLIAGKMASNTSQRGAWRSVAGTALAGGYLTYPILTLQQSTWLRDEYGIGCLNTYKNQVRLDDERLMNGVFSSNAEHTKSGEIARFIGWLRRELENWGLQLLFQVDPSDPRPQMALKDFFTQLYHQGALRGKLPENAFSIQQYSNDDNTLIFDIALAPAFPIDQIHLSISPEKLSISHV